MLRVSEGTGDLLKKLNVLRNLPGRDRRIYESVEKEESYGNL